MNKLSPLAVAALAVGLAGDIAAQTIAVPGGAASATARSLSGTVTDPSGAPAPGVDVSILPTLGAATPSHTDNQGRYSLEWRPIQVNVTGSPAAQVNLGGGIIYSVMARDPGRNLVATREIDASTTKQDLQLQTGLTLSGTVEDSDGKPVTTAIVQLTVITGNLGAPFNRQPEKVDSNGAFSLTALPQGLRYNLSVRALDHGSATSMLQAADTQTSDLKLPPIVLKTANLTIAGRVLDSSDKPVSGAQVQCNGVGQPNTGTRTDSRGQFELKVCEGRVQVIAFPPNGSGVAVQAQGGDNNVVIRLVTNPVTALASGLRQIISGNTTTLRGGRLKPPLMSWDYFKLWPADHKTVVYSVAVGQFLILAAVGAGIFWVTRRGRAG